MKIPLSAVLLIVWFYSAPAQIPENRTPKVYEVWIKMNNNTDTHKGILYKTGDSSIFTSRSIQDKNIREYNVRDIDLLKIRRARSLSRGAITGSAIGLLSGIVTVSSISEGFGILTVPVSTTVGLYFGVLGAGIGALTGTVKDRIPVNRSYDNLNKYRGNLKDYSFQQEENVTARRFQHRGYIGINMGIVYAMDEFASVIPVDDYSEMVMTGFGFKTFAGYRFNDKIGVNLSLINNSYPVENTETKSLWTNDALLANPVISLPLSAKFKFDLSPAIGYVTTSLWSNDKYVLNGDGFGFYLGGAVKYDYSKRWFASAGGGYLSSNMHYKEDGKGTVRSIDIELGLAYKFGMKGI